MSARRPNKRSEIIHRTKLFGGVATAAEIHAALGFRQRCLICKGPPAIQVRLYMPLEEFIQRNPEFAVAIALTNPMGTGIPNVMQTTFGPMYRYSRVTACRHHQKELEREAAKAPSYHLCEIDRGPGAEKPVVQVAHESGRVMGGS